MWGPLIFLFERWVFRGCVGGFVGCVLFGVALNRVLWGRRYGNGKLADGCEIVL